MEIFLIESSIIIDTMFPVVFFEIEIVIKDVLPTRHLAFFPSCLVIASLNLIGSTFG